MDEGNAGTKNTVTGDENTVVQAGVVHGDVIVGVPRVDPPRQLPTLPEHYTNCDTQLAAITSALVHRDAQDGPRIAVVKGAPGSGRSALCAVWAHRNADDYPDGHFLVRLGHTSRSDAGADAEQTRAALGELLDAVSLDRDRTPASLEGRSAAWRSATAGRRVLMIIDDAATAAQVRALLPGRGRSVALVVESGRLTALRTDLAGRFVDIDPLDRDAARLLLERMVGTERIAAEPDAVDRLLDRCGGLAGAVCVTGALLADRDRWPIARLADKFADDERALAELSRDPDLSLRVVFDNAYACRSTVARAVYRVLGAHPGDGDVAVPTVAAVLDAPVDDVADACDDLARAKLVTETMPGRFQLSGLLRPHARHAAGDGAVALRRSVVRHYRDRAVAASLAWMPTRGWFAALWPGLTGVGEFDRAGARSWMRVERANLRAAARATVPMDEPEWAGQFAVALWPLHDQDKFPHDMADVNDVALAASRSLARPHGAFVAAVVGLQRGFASRQVGRLDEAAACLEAARADAVAAGSAPAEASVVEALGLVRLDQDRLDDARAALRRTVELATALGEDRRIAMALFHGAKVEPAPVALEMLARSRALLLAQPSNEAYTVVKIDLWHGKKLIEANDRLDEAGRVLAEAAHTAEGGEWPDLRGQCYEARADAALALGDRTTAVMHLRSAYEIYQVEGMTEPMATVANRLAELG